MSLKKLKPCYSCDGENVVLTLNKKNDVEDYFVKCLSCRKIGPKTRNLNNHQKAIESTRAIWNNGSKQDFQMFFDEDD